MKARAAVRQADEARFNAAVESAAADAAYANGSVWIGRVAKRDHNAQDNRQYRNSDLNDRLQAHWPLPRTRGRSVSRPRYSVRSHSGYISHRRLASKFSLRDFT